MTYTRTSWTEAATKLTNAIEDILVEIAPGEDWRDVACSTADDILNDIIKCNAPRLWEASVNEDTQWQEDFICHDPDRIEEGEQP